MGEAVRTQLVRVMLEDIIVKIAIVWKAMLKEIVNEIAAVAVHIKFERIYQVADIIVGIMTVILVVAAATTILGDSSSVMIQAFTSFDVLFTATNPAYQMATITIIRAWAS